MAQHLFWAVISMWNGKAMAWWKAEDFVEEVLPIDQIDTAVSVICVNRSDAIGLAQALFTEHGGAPEEFWQTHTRKVIPEVPAPDYPEAFQSYLVLRAQAKENGLWSGPNLKPFQSDRLDVLDAYIARGVTANTPLA